MTSRPPLPEPLPAPVIDNHTHLDLARGDQPPWPLDDALAAAAEVNVVAAVQIGCDLASAASAVAAAEQHPQLLAGVALHPTEAARLGQRGLPAALREIERLADHPRVRVIGETGLDHYWVPPEAEAARRAQVESFRWHIDCAKRLGKALQIHDRDAHEDVVAVLEQEGAPERTVLHCFSGGPELARLCADRGWFASFAGTLTFKGASGLREAAALLPAELLLVETDSPYLTPMPHRGKENSSCQLPHTVRALAEVRGEDVGKLCDQLTANTVGVYGQWPATPADHHRE